MRRYHAYANKTNTASSTVPMFCITGGTTIRVGIYDILVSSDATPADNVAEYAIRRTTARGTASTSFTPVALDSGDPAAIATFDTAWSANPTITANSDLLQWAQNQRTTFRWVAAPGGELWTPATSGNGFALLCDSTSAAVSWNFSVHWIE